MNKKIAYFSENHGALIEAVTYYNAQHGFISKQVLKNGHWKEVELNEYG